MSASETAATASHSLRQRWVFATPDHETAVALAREARIPEVLAELLVERMVPIAHGGL